MNEQNGSGRVEFRAPSGFQAPENIEQGKDFDLVCSFRVKPDGTICMTKLGDVDMPGYGDKKDQDEDGDQKHKPGYSEYAKTMTETAPMPSATGGDAGPSY